MGSLAVYGLHSFAILEVTHTELSSVLGRVYYLKLMAATVVMFPSLHVENTIVEPTHC